MSLLSSLLHSAPLLGSLDSSFHQDDLNPPSTESTISSTLASPSLSLRSTPLSLSVASSLMDMEIDTVPPVNLDETHLIVSDPEDVFVEAPETQPPPADDQADTMYEGEETENEKMDHGGLGDVNQLSAFQTPDRKRTFEVDSKTITRPKKTSPLAVPLPEVFNQNENSQELVAPPRPIATSTPQAMSSTTATSSSSVSPRPAAATAAAGTPVPSAAAPPPAGLGETVTKRPVADRPAAARPRQQTMVVSSALTQGIKAAMEQEKASGLDEAASARIEARILALVQEKEREWAAKHDKLGQIMVAQKAEADTRARQAQADIEGLTAACEATNAAMASGFPCSRCSGSTSAASSSLPHLPPAPVLAAMSADKMAELARLKKENESLESENNKLHSQYNSLYETYSQQRAVIPTLKAANEELERGVRAERERFEKLKRHAEAKLDEASAENENLRKELARQEKAHENDTLAIRMRLKQRDNEIGELEQNLQHKKRQVSDLKEICNELIKKADTNASDGE